MIPRSRGAGARSRLLFLSYLSGGFGLAIGAQVNFLVPLRARELGASFDAIGLIIGTGALAAAVLSVAAGSLIDRLGPRRTFMLGTSATALLCLLFLLPTSYWWFLGLQPLLGVARNVGWVASQSYITSLGTPEQRPAMTGRFSLFSSVGQMVGPVLTGAVAQVVGLQLAMLVPAGYAVCFAVLGLGLAETRSSDHAVSRLRQGTGLRAALGLLAVRGIKIALLLTFARLWVNLAYTTFLPVHLVDIGFGPGLVGTVMATSGFVAALVAPTVGFWTRFLSEERATVLGLACGVSALLIAPHATFVPGIYVVPALVGVGAGMSLPLLLSIVTASAPARQRGVALGLRGMVSQTAATAAPVLIGPLIGALGIVLGFTAAGLVGGCLLLGGHVLARRGARELPWDTGKLP